MKKLCFAALAAAILWVDSGFGETVINSVPYQISAPGIYVVGSNLSYSSSAGGAIVIANHNVILDLGGHYLFNPTASNSSIGVYVQNAENVTIQNGTIQNGTIVGFNYGVYFNYLGGSAAGLKDPDPELLNEGLAKRSMRYPVTYSDHADTPPPALILWYLHWSKPTFGQFP
jgi:hypothetical protein